MTTPAIAEVCEQAVRAAPEPLPLKTLAALAAGKKSAKPRDKALVAPVLAELAAQGRIHEWPPAGGKEPRYWHRDLPGLVTEAVGTALEGSPATLGMLAAALKTRLPKLPAKVLKQAIAAVLGKWETVGRVRAVAATKTAIVYFAVPAAAGAGKDAGALEAAILEAVAALQPSEGNFVPVRPVRDSVPVKAAFDRTVLELARQRRIAPCIFDGPWPIPSERRLDYVEVEGSPRAAYVALALPRKE